VDDRERLELFEQTVLPIWTWLRKNRPREKIIEINDETLDIDDSSAKAEAVNP